MPDARIRRESFVASADTAEAAAYYVLAEATTNAERYAHASLISVRATWAPPLLRIEIVDDGSGGAHETAGCGLEGLRNRVETLGGTFEVESRAGHGTRVAAAIPAAADSKLPTCNTDSAGSRTL